MPGLIGFIHQTNYNEDVLDKMIDSMMHNDFYRVDKYICPHFGVARIHIGVFNPEIQPIFNKDKSLCIFFYGKIYDYQKEKEELILKGHKFEFENDAEFCLYSYIEYGLDFVKELNGTFVFALYNFDDKTISIVNDRYGLRPLYYTIDNNRLIFASEIKAILENKYFKKELNDEAVADWFAFGKILGDKTFIKDVKVLPPASILIYDGQNLSMKKYWDYEYKPDYDKSEDKFADELVKSFKKAVKIRMKDNYRYGVSLSGGLDSRVVVAAIDENKRGDVLSYTFGPLDCDEVKIAKKVSNKALTKFKQFDITPEMMIENMEWPIFHCDGLNYVGVSFGLPILREIIKDIDVTLDGYALDMTLGGSYLDKEILDLNRRDDLFNILYNTSTLFSSGELEKLFLGEYYNLIKYDSLKSFRNEFNKIHGKNIANLSDKFILQNHVRR